MKTTRLLSTVLFCLLALTACVDDDIKENYVFGSIVYSVEAATDGVSKRTIEIKSQEFRNPTDQEQTVTVDPYPDDFRYITLQSDDPLAFGWKDSEEVLIAQPVIDGSEVGELSNEECKVPYRKGENQYDSHYIAPREYTIPPHTLLYVGGSVTFKRTQVTYTLTLKGELTGEEKTVKGTLVYDAPCESGIYTVSGELE